MNKPPFNFARILFWGAGFFILFFFVSCSGNEKDTAGDSTTTQKEDSLSVHSDPIQTINESIKKDPSNAFLYYKRAQEYVKTLRNEEAKKDIERAISLDSNQAQFYVLRADLSFANRQTRDAREDLNKAIGLDSTSEQAHLKLAEIYLLLAKYNEAIRVSDKVLKLNVFNPKAYFMKGMCFKYLNDTARAISSLTTAVEQDHEYYNAHIQLGILYESKNPTFAIDYYNNAIQAQPGNLEAIYHKSFYLQKLRESRRALEGYALMLEIDDMSRNALFNSGFIYLVQLGNPDSAIYFFDRVTKLYATDIEAWYNLGLSYEENDEPKNALRCYQQALALKPDYTLAAKGIGRVE